MGFLGFYSLIGIIHVVTCQSAAFKESQFSKKTGVLYQSLYSWPEMTSCSGRPCTAFSCAKACLEEDGCVVFSHNEANATCILSRRPDYDPANHEIIHLEWNTYYTECPVKKGYVLYTNHQPPLCLHLDNRTVDQAVAKSLCRQEQANLVRVKTLDIYEIVQDLLTKAGLLRKYVYIGAEDTAVEGQFIWNDGTSLTLGTSLWRHPTQEGYESDQDCTAVSSMFKIIDSKCTRNRAFVCQYDV